MGTAVHISVSTFVRHNVLSFLFDLVKYAFVTMHCQITEKDQMFQHIVAPGSHNPFSAGVEVK